MQGWMLIVAIALPLHVLCGVLLSREVVIWPKISTWRRFFLMILIWFVPVFGAVLAYKSVKLDWFRKGRGDKGVAGGVFLEMDAVFNPGAKQVIEERQREQVERREIAGDKLPE